MFHPFLKVIRQFGMQAALKSLIFISVLVLIGYFANTINFEESFKALPFSNQADAQWYEREVGFALLGALAVCLSCPRQIISFFAAYFFGLFNGFLTAIVAVTLGCVTMYLFATFFKKSVGGLVTGKLDIAVQFWRENPFFATMIWRFMPAGSNFLTNLAAGALSIPAVGFVAGSAIGYVPQTLIFAIVGSGVRVESNAQLAVSAVLFFLSIVMGFFLISKYRKSIKASD